MSTGATTASPYVDQPVSPVSPVAPPRKPAPTAPLPPVVERGVEAARDVPRSSAGMILLRFVIGVLRFGMAALFCQTIAGAMIVVGWVTRRMQRSTFKHWFRKSAVPKQGVSFEQFTLGDVATAHLAHPPNGLLQQRFRASLREAAHQASVNAQLGGVLKAIGHSMWRNIRLGFQATSATWLVTLPCFGLLGLAWLTGWNISFYKLYEQAWIGPITGLSAIALVSIVMMFVPWAQARHAATGQWRAFFQFAIIAKLARRYWYLTLIMSMLYAAATLPLAFGQAAITFIGNGDYFDGASPEVWLNALNLYYFLITLLLVLPLFMVLRWLSAKFYAFAMLREVRRGRVLPGELGDAERSMLVRLGHIQADVDHLPDAPKAPTVTAAIESATLVSVKAAAWFAMGLASYIVWFAVMFEVMAANFVNTRLAAGWINHALIHLPWVRYIPPELMGG